MISIAISTDFVGVFYLPIKFELEQCTYNKNLLSHVQEKKMETQTDRPTDRHTHTYTITHTYTRTEIGTFLQYGSLTSKSMKSKPS